jgi:hypothetical protein
MHYKCQKGIRFHVKTFHTIGLQRGYALTLFIRYCSEMINDRMGFYHLHESMNTFVF